MKLLAHQLLEMQLLLAMVKYQEIFQFQKQMNLAILLRSGALPAPLNIIEERTVGPDLEKIQLRKVSFFDYWMLFWSLSTWYYNYRIFGLFANVSLIANLILIIAVLTLMGATLTLPGLLELF